MAAKEELDVRIEVGHHIHSVLFNTNIEAIRNAPSLKAQPVVKVLTLPQDYLNDKLQTATDLENIDTLLKNVIKQEALLKQQVLCRYLDICSISATDVYVAWRS